MSYDYCHCFQATSMAGGESFCENYLIINLEEASCFDLLRILCSKNLERREFFNSGVEGAVFGFRHRWIIFISAFLQKLFIWLKKPMAVVGSVVELCLNLPPCNGGYRHLIFNLFTGRLVRPVKSSTTFTSVVGNIDKRLDLEIMRNYQTWKYDASLAIMASKLSYENQSFVQNVVTHHWQMEFLGFYNFCNDYQEQNTTYAIMFKYKNLIVVAFRGTEPFDADAWRTNVDISWYEFPGVGKMHGGFMKALGLQKSTGWPERIPPGPARKSFAYYTLREKLKILIHENGDAKLILTGHSLGGALAILFASVLAMHEEETLLRRLEGVYTFGQPRVGNEQFGEYMKEKLKLYDVKYFRYVYCNDVVPRLPYDDTTFMFKHFGPCMYFNSCYIGQILEEEPNKNYFSIFHVVPKILNAVYELIRSFMMPWTKGKEYGEGWFMKVFRITALIIPGLTEHYPLDYVNVTKLGNFPSSVYPLGPNDHNPKYD